VRASANVSYENAARDIESYTGMKISARTQQRIVHRYKFPEEKSQNPIQEISLDGGKVRLRTEEKGSPCIWRDYKAICVNLQGRLAWFQDNKLINWVNEQILSFPLNCIGDGHARIWNIIKQFVCPGEKREILDWYHLIENLHKVGAPVPRVINVARSNYMSRIKKKVDMATWLSYSPLPRRDTRRSSMKSECLLSTRRGEWQRSMPLTKFACDGN